MTGLTIGKAARAAGVGVETIRFYERRGLIQQPRKPVRAGFRVYTDDVVTRIRFIRQAQEMSFSLGEIAELLSLRADPDADCAEVRKRAQAKLSEVDRKMVALDRMRTALMEVINACPARGALRHCSILDALETSSTIKPVPKSSRSGSSRRRPDMKTVTLNVEGMHCDGCASTLEALVGAEAGVEAVLVTYKSGEARILFDPKKTNESRLVEIVKRPGYRVVGDPAS